MRTGSSMTCASGAVAWAGAEALSGGRGGWGSMQTAGPIFYRGLAQTAHVLTAVYGVATDRTFPIARVGRPGLNVAKKGLSVRKLADAHKSRWVLTRQQKMRHVY